MDKFLIIKCCVGYFVLYSLLLVHGIELSCNQTPYPHVCKHYIDTNHPIDKIPTTLNASSSSYNSFHDMALKVTMDQAINYYKLFSTIELSNFKDTRAKLAWEDCLELYEDTINHLNNSMSSNKIKDKLTWQSASIANHQTCQNGFIDFNLSSNLNYFPSMLTNFTKLLSNSLFITNTIALASSSSSSPSTKQVGGRKLLSSDDGFPNWVSSSDRRLLQATRAAPIKADIVVAQDGSGNYKTISEGVAVASKLSGKRRMVVHVKAGVYDENVDIKDTVKKLMIIGDGIDVTIVTGNRNAQDGFTTFRSATFAVSCEGFIAKDITFENTAGPQKHQAVALRSGADHSIFYRCSFRGYQDTLYVHTQRQFYRDCDIYGTVDFIFGDAVTVLQNCNIYVRKPMSNQQNMVTAQGRTDPNENTGIIIQNSLITASAELKQVQSNFETFLGRPWQNYSRTVVLKSNIDDLVNPLGWVPWSGSFGLSTLYYGEYMNTGAGANTKGRVKWVGFHVINDPNEAVKFSVGDFLNGDSWIPATGIPFDVGL